MKALVYEGARSMVLRDVPNPSPSLGDHLIRVEAVGICGSDMHAYLGHDERRPAPLILGHEAAGVIVGGPRDGDCVTVNPLVTCGTCAACTAGRENLCPDRQIISMPPREGAFAQFVTIPERNLVGVPEGVPLRMAALAEPLAVGWHAARLALATLHPGMERRALILGGGAIGLATSLSLEAMGCPQITISEPAASRRAYLQDRCGQHVTNAPTGHWPLLVDAVGYATTRSAASAHVAPGGVLMHVGLGDNEGGLDVRRMTLQEITFVGTYAYSAQDFRDTAQAIFDGRLGPLDWTETRALEEGADAFADLLAHKVAAPKIVLTPWN
ncbi:2-dehydro-3-deoxy-L-rhamnonate dehydrogenase (NAD(+)) [Defluviimonas aquaemixtae]|uniref:2-dehydro-3-deoxy-L-rhamnonate dehydrogenase (NAD(+)) n=1 Tax=Albidovulum aquaemixtae TaxID=1542388 RepID=A0A2R8B893_9RHOB|nr:alcohol dehydrogenase catalytic domain-containing protein [Defluviimonas aquaemixtae]SPH18816.1 2-dehydro-3-deoxy-L-rhamnonate dehydrogenase (NAD(+)) [Defluviimonas aquaemixtae]